MKIMQIQYRIFPKLIQLAWYGCILSIAMLIFLPFVATSDDKARIRLSTDLNNIDSIQIQDSKVIFKTTGGKIIFNKTDSMWRVDLHQLHPKKELTEYEFWRDRYSLINQFFPDAAVRATYKTVISRAAHDFTELILLQTAGEGAVTDRNWIIDTLAHKTYSFPFEKFKTVEFDDDHIWIGGFTHFTRMHRATGRRDDFIVLPYFKRDSRFLFDDGFWIATNGIGIEWIDFHGNTIAFWSIKDILEALPMKFEIVRENWENIKRRTDEPLDGPVFTNFQHDDQNVYVGCHFTFYNTPAEKNAYLLIYSKSSRKWSWRHLKDIDAMSLIKLDRHNLWVGVNEYIPEEGGELSLVGGVFLYDLLADSTHDFSGIKNASPKHYSAYQQARLDSSLIHHQFLVTKLDVMDSVVVVDTYNFVQQNAFSRKTIFKIDKQTLKVEVVATSAGDQEKNRDGRNHS